MKPICSICGRRTMPAVYLGNEAIGPTCAQKLGLTKTRAPAAKASRLRFPSQKVRQAQAGPQTIELFPETL